MRTLLSSALILDDSGSGFTETGAGWTAYPIGYNGEQQYNFSAPGAATGTWQASSLAHGAYLVQATWNGSSNHTANAAYSIYDGNTLIKTVSVNQQQNPVGPVFGGVAFQTLATVTISSGTVRVAEANQGSNAVIADAIRIASTAPSATFGGPASVNAGSMTTVVTFGSRNRRQWQLHLQLRLQRLRHLRNNREHQSHRDDSRVLRGQRPLDLGRAWTNHRQHRQLH